jgi:hypothetical protein
MDGISTELLQVGGETVVTLLRGLFQTIHEVPDDWRMAIVTPISPKADKSDSKNYRGTKVCSVSQARRSRRNCNDALRFKSCVEMTLAEE